ncbi:MAG: sigma-70 family RNA polymerase sigma factor [Clostridia bacterium]|nr:sigma-70 family RNA polymerase sigma factor [Clostridia bacterium]
MRTLFEQEYPKYEKSLFLIALSYLHNTEDARDALQDAALAAYRSLDTLQNKAYFKTWLTLILINKCKNFLKAKRSTVELSDDIKLFTNVPESELEIVDAICRMNRERAMYISLRFYNDMSYDEVAKALKIPVSTVKYRTRKALEELKSLLEGDV